jgi:hypothetical protein
MSDRVSVAAFDGMLRRYLCLGHRAVNDVSLNPFAFWARKRSQVLTQSARLDRRQRDWRIAIHVVEHESPPGALALTFSGQFEPSEIIFSARLKTHERRLRRGQH